MKILGLSCYYHDSAACLLDDGRIVAAAQEERFTRKKHDAGFPTQAVRYCVEAGRVGPQEDVAVVFYEKPILKFHRILDTHLSVAPAGLTGFVRALPIWLKEKLWIGPRIQSALEDCGLRAPDDILFCEHHESHAASAFYPSPFAQAAVVTMDGAGEWATTTIGAGEGNRLRLLKETRFPHSLGLLYSAFTYFTGFKVNSGEYKLMGLAPYGRPIYKQRILEHLVDIKEDGSFRLAMKYFGYLGGLAMTNERFAELFDGPPRKPEAQITRREMDLARSIQEVTEEIVLRIVRHARQITDFENLCLAGGVTLNCVANGRIVRERIFKNLWIQPAAGDAGGALGAAFALWHNGLDKPRLPRDDRDAMQGSFLGPEDSTDKIRAYLDANGCVYDTVPDEAWPATVAGLIAGGGVVGLHQGRMEFGPRALGNRSVVGDARSTAMQSTLNLKIKYRESFRPFAPSCLEDRVAEYFELDSPSPYMLLVAAVRPERRIPGQGAEDATDLIQWVNRPRSDVPAITHVDYSARIQSVSRETNPRYHALLQAFRDQTGCGLIVNTSFNVRGEPLVCSPEDSYRCFMRTEMDYLAIGPFLLKKTAQPPLRDDGDWRKEFALD
jgi:carbamoyltransferase